MSWPTRSTLGRAAAVLLATAAAGCARGGGVSEPKPQPAEPSPAVATARPGTVTEHDVRDLRVARAEELLVGRFPGVEVYRLARGGISVRIRGTGTTTTGGEPLYVVDGVPLSADPAGGLAFLDPHDIARIQVLKDAAATAFYGIRGGNGVILITTTR